MTVLEEIEEKINEVKRNFDIIIPCKTELVLIIDRLKCCANCRLRFTSCDYPYANNHHSAYCSKWQFDELTREQREV